MYNTRLAIVVPAFNEEETLPRTIATLSQLITDYIARKIIGYGSYILIVDDGSSDRTWEIIRDVCKNNKFVKGIKFTKNFGNQSAILAGYISAHKIGCDGVLTIDADLQQDETKIEEFVKYLDEGYEIICGVRNSYDKKMSLKSVTSAIFYKVINTLGVNLQPNHSEYRLLSGKTLDILSNYRETNIFIRGMIYDLGLKTKYVNYDIKRRQDGESKFSFISLAKLAVCGIVSFSTRPLRIVFFTGFIIASVSVFLAFLLLISLIFHVEILPHEAEPFEIYETFISGVQILCIGIIGEYIGQILQEVKSRPRFIIDEEKF